MTDSGNIPELQDLEPLEAGGPVAATAAADAQALHAQALQAQRSGLGPPAFNLACTDKASYRLLMASVLMTLGCLMPFSADPALVGYKTMSGAVFTFISLGMLWTWWGAIYNNRSSPASLKWLALSFVPFAAQVMNLVAYDAEAQQRLLGAAIAAGHIQSGAEISSWDTLFGDMGTALGKSLDAGAAALRVENFFRCFGAGKIILLIGAVLAEVFFILGLAGGAKQNKQQKLARQQQAAERKRR